MIPADKSASFWRQTRGLTWPFWVANLMEMIERLAYYGVRVVIPIYIAQADEIGGLHFSQGDKGVIFMWWALVQSALPVFTGGFADRYGYKRQIVLAVFLKVLGYLMMASQREFAPFLAGCLVLAAGTAIFKPPVQGTFVQTLTNETSGVGWGFFYQVVNIGGFLGPPLAHFLYGFSWPAVFYGCAALVSLNLLWLLTYKDVHPGAKMNTGVWEVAVTTARHLWNIRLLTFMLIASIFWAVLMQLWDMLPNFIVDWVDSAGLAIQLPQFMLSRDLSRGPQIAQEWVIDLNPLLIILCVAPLSWFVNLKMRRLTSMLCGFIIASLGVYVAGASRSIYICLAGIACFTVGEMLCSPKMSEYLGVIAPPDKKALFMGYANIPIAVGWGYGSYFGGQIYARAGEKAGLALRYLSEVQRVHELPERSRAFAVLTERLGQTPAQVTQLLWERYDPSQVWTPFALAGIAAAVTLWVFNRFARRWKDINA
ncbi:MAG: MFS transporter [Deltaproteobacteria bacterium]|nr:MFS transporter [Deltaproteobacteria bacterium]